MLDMFASAKSVLGRADHHITDLQSILSASSLDRKYTYRADHDPVSGKYIHKITFSQNFSDDVSCIMFDAVNNLRASLDQMTYAVAMRHNPGRDAESFAPFPFAADSAHWPNKIRGLKNDIPPEIVAIFEGFKPYKGGNNLLWALNKLANIKKHAILVPTAFGGAMIFVPLTLSEEVGFEFANGPPFFTSRYEIELFRSIHPEPHPEVDVAPTIVIRHPEEIIDGKAPIPFLQMMRVEVGIIFARTENTCEVIGWT
jgi:hypothetical protein